MSKGESQVVLTGSCHCGAVRWTYDGDPGSATSCNCTVCRRYGALWIYGWENAGGAASGKSVAYVRGESIEFHFCPTCGCLTHYRGRQVDKRGRRRLAANIRMIDDPDRVAGLPIDPFEGLDRFVQLPRDGRCVADLWY